MTQASESLAYSGTIEKGKQRVNQQNTALIYMFQCAPSIAFDKEIVTSLTEMLAFHGACELSGYIKGTAYEIDGYDSYSNEQKKIYDCLCVLEDLKKRRLIDDPDFSVTFKMDGVNEDALRQYLRGLDRLSAILYKIMDTGACEIPYERGSVEIKSATYGLSDKGYDVALMLQTHADQKEQSATQYTITKQAADAAASSAKTAKMALCAAVVIGLGSMGNLALNFWECFGF